MKTLALFSIALALPLAAQYLKDVDGHPYCANSDSSVSRDACPSSKVPPIQTPLTPEEHDAYVLAVIQDLVFQNALLENLRTHKAGNEDVENRDRAHTERLNALKKIATDHHACEGGDWNIAKKEWNCPTARTQSPQETSPVR
jgi:hypothetical protein